MSSDFRQNFADWLDDIEIGEFKMAEPEGEEESGYLDEIDVNEGYLKEEFVKDYDTKGYIEVSTSLSIDLTDRRKSETSYLCICDIYDNAGVEMAIDEKKVIKHNDRYYEVDDFNKYLDYHFELSLRTIEVS